MIDVDGLEVQFPGVRLGPLTLCRDRGIVRIDGPNGSGKTSLLRAIAASIPRSAGRVSIHGLDPETEARARRHIGYVPAHPELPGFLTVDEAWSMLADLRGCPDWDGRALRDAFDLPGGLRLDRTSTGMRRKAEILAALAGDPDVLLLDETLANIDVAGRQTLVDLLDAGRQDRVVLLTHHGPCPVEPDGIVSLG